MHNFEHRAHGKNSMPPEKGRGKGRGTAKVKGSYSNIHRGTTGAAGMTKADYYDDYYSYGSGGKGKWQWNRGTRANAWQEGGKCELKASLGTNCNSLTG